MEHYIILFVCYFDREIFIMLKLFLFLFIFFCLEIVPEVCNSFS